VRGDVALAVDVELDVDAAEVGRIEADLEMVPAGGSLCGDLDGEPDSGTATAGVWACACAATAVAAVALTGVDVVVAVLRLRDSARRRRWP